MATKRTHTVLYKLDILNRINLGGRKVKLAAVAAECGVGVRTLRKWAKNEAGLRVAATNGQETAPSAEDILLVQFSPHWVRAIKKVYTKLSPAPPPIHEWLRNMACEGVLAALGEEEDDLEEGAEQIDDQWAVLKMHRYNKATKKIIFQVARADVAKERQKAADAAAEAEAEAVAAAAAAAAASGLDREQEQEAAVAATAAAAGAGFDREQEQEAAAAATAAEQEQEAAAAATTDAAAAANTAAAMGHPSQQQQQVQMLADARAARVAAQGGAGCSSGGGQQDPHPAFSSRPARMCTGFPCVHLMVV
jgi:hypothetical protein